MKNLKLKLIVTFIAGIVLTIPVTVFGQHPQNPTKVHPTVTPTPHIRPKVHSTVTPTPHDPSKVHPTVTPTPKEHSTDHNPRKEHPTPTPTPSEHPKPDAKELETSKPSTEGDAMPPQTSRQIGDTKIKVINVKPPIQFEPFDLSFIQKWTHQVVTPDTVLTLKNKKQITAQKYLDQLNEYEKGFNELGYTLRGGAQNIELQELEPETAFLPATTHKTSSGNVTDVEKHVGKPKYEDISIKSIQELGTQFQNEFRDDSNREQLISRLPQSNGGLPPSIFLRPEGEDSPDKWDDSRGKRIQPLGKPPQPPAPEQLPPPTPGTAYSNIPFRWSEGISGFRVNIGGRISNFGSTNSTRVEQSSYANVTIFGWQVPLLNLRSSMLAPRTDGLTPSISMTVGRDELTIIPGQPVTDQQWTKSDGEISKELARLEKTIRFWIGPIPVSATFGVRGVAGIKNYWAGLRPLFAKAQYTPFIKAELYVKAGVNAGIVSFGVRGNLTLLEEEIAMNSETSLKMKFPKLDTFLSEEYYAQGNLKALSGSLSLYACIDVLFWDVCATQNLANWRGYTLDRQDFVPFQTKRTDVRAGQPPVTAPIK